MLQMFFFFSSRRRHTRFKCDWSSDVCSSDLTSKPAKPIGAGDIHLQPFAKGLDSPVYITYAPGQTNREYVVEQAGRIMVVGMDGTVRAQPFLDIHQLVLAGGGRGLLSFTFHPHHPHTHYLLLNSTAPPRTPPLP